MGQISLLHIGDIHYENKTIHGFSLEPPTESEYEWSKLSKEEKEKIAPYCVKLIKKQLFKDIEEKKYDSIILTGDLCSGGQIKDYEACLNYLETQFQNFCNKVKRNDLEIAVGNHDLNAEYGYDPNNTEERFVKFRDLLTSKKMREYPISDINEKFIETNDGKVLLLNVNSCLEFGNLDLHSKRVRDTINTELENGASKSERNRLLNVPYIKKSLLDTICTKIKENQDCLPILITHHNFLRSRFFNPDTEYDGMLNDGIIMQKLLDLNRSILILHGHIHDDPIRVINSKIGKIVYASAPLLFPLVDRKEGEKFGYNVIHIIFSNNHEKTPLGCEIEFYRLKNTDIVSDQKETIKFLDSSDVITNLSSLEKNILKKILCLNKDIYLGSLFTILKNEKILDNDDKLNKLFQIVQRLYWLKLLQFREVRPNVEYSIITRWF